jgi:hypothetical protein
MNKTIYLPDDEGETWEKARRFANDRLSPVILKALKEYIVTKESEAAEAAGLERIELEFEDSDENHLPKKKAFRGKWICPPDSPCWLWSDREEGKGRACAVAVTAKGNVVVYSWKQGAGFDPEIGEPYNYQFGYQFLVFPSFHDAASDPDVNYAVREAVRRRGVPVEELDI